MHVSDTLYPFGASCMYPLHLSAQLMRVKLSALNSLTDELVAALDRVEKGGYEDRKWPGQRFKKIVREVPHHYCFKGIVHNFFLSFKSHILDSNGVWYS